MGTTCGDKERWWDRVPDYDVPWEKRMVANHAAFHAARELGLYRVEVRWAKPALYAPFRPDDWSVQRGFKFLTKLGDWVGLWRRVEPEVVWVRVDQPLSDILNITLHEARHVYQWAVEQRGGRIGLWCPAIDPDDEKDARDYAARAEKLVRIPDLPRTLLERGA